MPQPIKVLQPDYFARFQCIGPDCEDSCCDGMGVILDKKTYDKYQACSDPGLRALFKANIVLNRTKPSDNHYGQITASKSRCPFLTEERLCAIQAKLGEDYLSRTCSVYPRAISTVDGVIERSLYMSCPEAVRLVLLNPEPLRLDPLANEPPLRFGGFPSLATTERFATGKPFGAFQEVRAFILSLLQNRAYRLWERLIVLGMFCDQLNQIGGTGCEEAVMGLIASFKDYIEHGFFAATLDNVSTQPAVQLGFILNSLEYRVHSEPTGQRFLDCYGEFLNGIGCTPDAAMEEMASRYTAAHAHYNAFMDSHEYILENYVVNYVFRTLFPFGPQQGSYVEQRSITMEFVLLAVHYSFIRSLLVGIAAYHKDAFGPIQIVKLVQSFAKAVEHNRPFLKRVLQSLEENQMTDIAVMALLIKSPSQVTATSSSALSVGPRAVLKASSRAKKALAQPESLEMRATVTRRARRQHPACLG